MKRILSLTKYKTRISSLEGHDMNDKFSKFNNENCGCPRTENGCEELQYDCGNAIVHGPEKERRSRKGGDELKYSKGFQVRARV